MKFEFGKQCESTIDFILIFCFIDGDDRNIKMESFYQEIVLTFYMWS